MDELDLYKSIANAIKLKKKEKVSLLTDLVLANAAGQGNKDANRKVKSIVKEANDDVAKEQHREMLKTSQGKLVNSKLLSPKELKRLTGAKGHDR
ncbi:MAG: hypothetical protein ACTSW1_08270 [Candidatus Hodarchaeales archaeon]